MAGFPSHIRLFPYLRELVPPSFPHCVRQILTAQAVARKEYQLWPSSRLSFLCFILKFLVIRSAYASSREFRIARYLCSRLRLIQFSRCCPSGCYSRMSVSYVPFDTLYVMYNSVSFDTCQYLLIAFSYHLI